MLALVLIVAAAVAVVGGTSDGRAAGQQIRTSSVPAACVPRKLGVVFVIDDSGSNTDQQGLFSSEKGTDPRFLRADAVGVGLGYLPRGTLVSAVTFATEARVAVDVTRLGDDRGESIARTVRRDLKSNGYTNYEAAFQLALAQLRKMANVQRIVVFLSDGVPYPSSEHPTSDAIAREVIPIHTVGYGKERILPVLIAIAQGSKASYRPISNIAEAQNAFANIVNPYQCNQPITDAQPTLRPNKTWRKTFRITRGTPGFSALTTWTKGSPVIKLRRPDGSMITNAGSLRTGEARYKVGRQALRFDVKQPKIGTWTLTARSTEWVSLAVNIWRLRGSGNSKNSPAGGKTGSAGENPKSKGGTKKGNASANGGRCRQALTVGALHLSAGCWRSTASDVWEATGVIGLNGLKLQTSGTLRADLNAMSLTAKGELRTDVAGVRVVVARNTTWKPSTTLRLDTAGKLKGIPVSAAATARFTAARGGSTQVTFTGRLKIPRFETTVDGTINVNASSRDGVQLTGFTFTADRDTEARASGLGLKSFRLTYEQSTRRWAGSASILLPTAVSGVEGGASFSERRFERAFGKATGRIPIFGGLLTLTSVRIDVVIEPRVGVKGEVEAGLGPTVRVAASNYSILSLSSSLSWASPSSWTFEGKAAVIEKLLEKVDGSVTLDGSLRLDASRKGFVATLEQAQLEASVKNYAFGNARVSGFVSNEAFNLEGTAKLNFPLWSPSGEALVSSKGLAGCGNTQLTVKVPRWGVSWGQTVSVGMGYGWGDGDVRVMWKSCGVGDWRVIQRTAALAPLAVLRSPSSSALAQTIPVPPNVPFEVFAASAAAGIPDIVVRPPSGAPIDTRGPSVVDRSDVFIWHNPQERTVYVVVPNPRAGTWLIDPAPGSLPLTTVRSADGLVPPEVRATVRGAGPTRTIDYTVTGATGGQTVTLWESPSPTRVGALQIVPATTTSGRRVFTPNPIGPARRYVWATLNQDGIPYRSALITRFSATPQRLPAAPRLTVRRSKTRVTATWAAVRNADRYDVRVARSDGSQSASVKAPNRRRISVPASRTTRVRVRVRAQDRFGRSGPWTSRRAPTRR